MIGYLWRNTAVMAPLVSSFDKLQGEKHIYLGYVTPTIIVLRKLLIQSTHLKYCKPLCITLIHSLEKRFYYLFDLNDPKGKDYILAS